MNETLTFRAAEVDDMPRIGLIIRQAQRQMREAGSLQWQNGYPAAEHIAGDIEHGYGYVLCKPGEANPETVIAYGAVVFDGEPAYAAIDGRWLSEGNYVVVHRLAVADGQKGRGVAAEFMRRTETLAHERGIRALRVDTNFDNRPMLRMLSRLGFAYCGKIVYESGERLAFEKRIGK